MINDSNLADFFSLPSLNRSHMLTSSRPSWRRSMRKRRANSDSELPLLPIVDYDSHGINDDSAIDLLSDSIDRLDRATMDPSQMFIGLSSNINNSFTSVNANALNLMMDENHINSNDDAFGLYSNENITGPILPAQMFYATNPDEDEAANKQTHDETVGEKNTNFTEDELSNLFPMNGESQPETVLRHIPAKYRKSSLPAEVLNRPLETTEIKDNYTANKNWLTERVDKEVAKEQGVQWKDGPWSLEEEEMLRTNIDNYCEKNSIVDPTLMIYSNLRDLRRSFYRDINQGLNRTLFAIYRKIRRMYDTRNYAGRYTKDEEERLLELHEEFGASWADIGQAMGRSAPSVKDKIRLLKNRKNSGHWSDDELELLSEAVHSLTKTKVGDSVTTGINWKSVAEKVGTRSEKQCFDKWLNYLNWKEAGGKKWIKTDEIELINRVSNACVTSENNLDWARLSNGWECVRSPQWLHKKWWKLKKEVPNYKTCTFAEILLHLQGPYIDSIWERCKKKLLKKTKTKGKGGQQSENVVDEAPQPTSQSETSATTTSLTLNIQNTSTIPTQIYPYPADLAYEPLQYIVVTPASAASQNISTNQSASFSTLSNQNASFSSLSNAAENPVFTTNSLNTTIAAGGNRNIASIVSNLSIPSPLSNQNLSSIQPNVQTVNNEDQKIQTLILPKIATTLSSGNNCNTESLQSNTTTLLLRPPSSIKTETPISSSLRSQTSSNTVTNVNENFTLNGTLNVEQTPPMGVNLTQVADTTGNTLNDYNIEVLDSNYYAITRVIDR